MKGPSEGSQSNLLVLFKYIYIYLHMYDTRVWLEGIIRMIIVVKWYQILIFPSQKSQVVAATLTEKSHEALRQEGLDPILASDLSLGRHFNTFHRYAMVTGIYVWYIYMVCMYIYMVYVYIYMVYIYIYTPYIYIYGICICYIYIYWPYTHYPWSSYIKLDFIHHVGRWEESMNFHTHIQLYHRMTINHTHSIHNVLTAAQVWTSKLGIRALLVVAMDFIPMLWGELDKSMWYQYEITPEIRLLKACIVLWDVATVSRWTNGTV